MVPEDEEASTSGQQREKEEEMSDIKKRTMKALNCKRQDLPDGSVLFSFSEKPLTRRQKAALIMEEENCKSHPATLNPATLNADRVSSSDGS